MIVGFDSSSYVFQEGVMIGTICVESSGLSDAPFNVTVTTSDGSAQGVQMYTSAHLSTSMPIHILTSSL